MPQPPPELPERNSLPPNEPIHAAPKPTNPAPTPEPPGSSGSGLSMRLRRWLPRFRRNVPRDSTGGISISGDANVRVEGDLVAGDKVYNIGALSVVVPTRFFIVLVGLALLSAVVVWYVITPDKMPTGGGSFNIAVADFGVQDAQSNVTSSADASTWSKWMFDTLLNESKGVPPELTVTVWHDSLRPFQERATIGLVRGTTPAEREKAAEQKARDLQADLLIYGNFDTDQTPGTFVPEFYLAKGRDEADEMRGVQAMGKPFELPSQLNPADQLTRRYLERNLTPRAVALAWFVPGLIDDLSGDFATAYGKFQNGLVQSEGLQDDQGKAVFYYYLGRQALFLSQNEKSASEFFADRDPALTGAEAALNAAEKAFATALEMDSEYARASFGMGQVFYQRANLILSNPVAGDAERRQVPALLDKAVGLHKRALELAADSPDSLIDIQSRIQLGLDFLQQGRYAIGERDFAVAEQRLVDARAELETGLRQLPAEQHRTLAQTHVALAATLSQLAIARQGLADPSGARGYFLDAVKAYEACVREAAALPEDEYLSQLRKTCESTKEAVRQAAGN